MKQVILILLVAAVFGGCAVKKPYTNALKEEYSLTDQSLKGVQFFVSSQIVLVKSKSKGSTGTTSDGTIVSSSSKEQDRIIILPRTKCILDETTEKGTVLIRFETGEGNFITFATRPNQENGKYYFQARAVAGQGIKITYGDKEEYTVSDGQNAYLIVKIKKSQRTKRKDRIVKGMKV